MSQALVTVRPETAAAFLPDKLHDNGSIDLSKFADLARDAITGSERSLAAAQAIADGGWFTRFLESGDMQRHVIQSVGHIGNMSKLSLALSAICNDLAAANLEHGRRIEANNCATKEQLDEIQRLTAGLRDHLTRVQSPTMPEGVLPSLGRLDAAEQNGAKAWLASLSEEIDLQYSTMRDELEKVVRLHDRVSVQVGRIDTGLATLGTTLADQQAATNLQLGSLTSRVAGGLSEAAARADKTDAVLRDSHGRLAAALKELNQRLMAQHLALTNAVQSAQTEHDERLAMGQAMQSALKAQDRAVRATINALNKHLLKRFMWVAGSLMALQLAGFAFLAFKMRLMG